MPSRVRSGILSRDVPLLWKPLVIRYADDFVVLHRDLEGIKHAQKVAARVAHGHGAGDEAQQDADHATLTEVDGNVGFEFLGFHFRQYPRGVHRFVHNTNGDPTGFSPVIGPSPDSQKRLLEKVRAIVRNNLTVRQEGLIAILNRVLPGVG